jgi:hypothetical protein
VQVPIPSAGESTPPAVLPPVLMGPTAGRAGRGEQRGAFRWSAHINGQGATQGIQATPGSLVIRDDRLCRQGPPEYPEPKLADETADVVRASYAQDDEARPPGVLGG